MFEHIVANSNPHFSRNKTCRGNKFFFPNFPHLEVDVRHVDPLDVQQPLRLPEEVRPEQRHLHVLGHGELLAETAHRQRGGAPAVLEVKLIFLRKN